MNRRSFNVVASTPDPAPRRTSPTLSVARRRIATLFIPARSSTPCSAPRAPIWQAWLMTGWCVTVCVIYFVHLLRAFR
jgi:hypothetical protein